MNRFFLIALAAFALTACGPRNIKLPNLAMPPVVAAFETGVNARTKVFDYEIPEVKYSVQKTTGFMSVKLAFGIPRLGKATQQQQRSFIVKRGLNPSLDVSCETVQGEGRVGRKDFTRHTYTCGGSGFELVVDEPKRQFFQGAVHIGDVSLDLESTDQMAAGAPMRPSGFHIRRNGRWLASFEYFQFGNAYLGTDLTAEERDAVLVAMVSIQSTNHWLARDIDQNQAGIYRN